MFGAFLSWVFRIAYIKWRRRLVASLPIVRYTGPGWEAVPVAPASRFNTSALPAPHPSSSSSLGAADYSEEEERLVLLRSAVEQSLAQLAHAVTSAADPQVSAFLAYLSTNATHVFDELQVIHVVLRLFGDFIKALTCSSSTTAVSVSPRGGYSQHRAAPRGVPGERLHLLLAVRVVGGTAAAAVGPQETRRSRRNNYLRV
jgi:hypothetical protein